MTLNIDFSQRDHPYQSITYDGEYSTFIEAIHDETLKNYLETHYINNEILKQGDDAPGFYLKNIDNEYFSLADFGENIIYISFWSTGCKPCLREIPEENRLAGTFNDENVKIINICLSSTEESWRSVSEKYQIETINLFARLNPYH